MAEPDAHKGNVSGTVLALTSACTLALGILIAVISGSSSNGALVTRVSNLETLAVRSDHREERIEQKIDDLTTKDSQIAVLQSEVNGLDGRVSDQELRWRALEERAEQPIRPRR